MTFKTFNLDSKLEHAIDELGFLTPTEVQCQAIPHLLEGQDLIVRSKTGSGKTAAFGIPILQRLIHENLVNDASGKPHREVPLVLILAPTRELAVQVSQDLQALARFLPITITTVYGQHSMNIEIDALEKGSSIVVGTPGRVMDHIRQGNLNTKQMAYLVLDEADKMMDMGFLDQVVGIIKHLPKKRNTMLFSATMPLEIQNICWEYMQDPQTIEIISETKTVDSIAQCYYRVEPHEKRLNLHRLLLHEKPQSCMVFCNTRAAVDRIQEFLEKKGFKTEALHGAITQAKRLKTIERFKQGAFEVLVATDVAARGLHVDDLSLVINYDLPVELDSYVHRIGRTGRAGNGGRAIALVTSEDQMTLYALEEHIGAMIPEEDSAILLKSDRHHHNYNRLEGRPDRPASHQARDRQQTSDRAKGKGKPATDRSQTHGKGPLREKVAGPQPQPKAQSATLVAPSAQAPAQTSAPKQPTRHHHSSHKKPAPVVASPGARIYSQDEIEAAKERFKNKENATPVQTQVRGSWVKRVIDGIVSLVRTKS